MYRFVFRAFGEVLVARPGDHPSLKLAMQSSNTACAYFTALKIMFPYIYIYVCVCVCMYYRDILVFALSKPDAPCAMRLAHRAPRLHCRPRILGSAVDAPPLRRRCAMGGLPRGGGKVAEGLSGEPRACVRYGWLEGSR